MATYSTHDSLQVQSINRSIFITFPSFLRYHKHVFEEKNYIDSKMEVVNCNQSSVYEVLVKTIKILTKLFAVQVFGALKSKLANFKIN